MASDHQEPSRRKHRRNSDDESEEPSKRHKHRHHHRRHRHHRSQKLDEEEVETKHDTGEISHPPPPAVVELNGNLRPDYDDMEEGEILEDDQILNVEKKNMEGGRVEVDGSSLSLEGHNVEKVGSGSKTRVVYSSDDGFMTNGTVLRKENSRDDTKIGDEVDLQRNSNMENHGNGDISKEEISLSLRSSSPEGLEKQKGRNDGESESRSRRKSSENAVKMHKSLGSLPSHDKHHEKDRSMNRSQLHNQAAYDTDTKRTRDFEDDTVSGHHKEYRHGSRDSLRDKERERSSSRSRHTVRVYSCESPEARARDRERSLESRDQDCREIVRESARERNGNRERDREREKERNREEEKRRVRERERERSRDKYYDRGSRNHNYYDVDGGYRDRDRHSYDHRRRRRDETEHRDRSRNDPDKVHSSKADIERDTEERRRDEVEEEDYQGKIVLQLAEHEEEQIDRIKEESRKRRQAILEKYKAQQSQQKHESNLEVTVPNVVKETHNDQTEEADIFPVDTSFSVGKSPEQIEPPASKISGSRALGEGTPKSERSDDMFHDDIFGDSPAGVRKPGREVSIERSGLHDNWDDAEGYYSYRFGEILDGRYEVVAAHGKGVFSSVVRAKDLKAGPGDPDEVAIKIIRSNDTMHKAGLEELVILKKLVGADVEDRRHCVRFLSSFKYRNHLCLVFESLHMNLREVLKKFGRNIGLKLTAVRTYTKQLFIALKHLRNCGVLHCDIKPDNMLVNDAKNVLKLCDFGNAMFAGKNEITPYLVSRFYRAPEIILGLPYDHPMDIWSVGCCLYELYTGKVLFPGPSNNDMLRLHMELKGPFPKKMLRKGAFIDQHFDQDLNFLAAEEDPVTKKAIKRLMLNIKPKDIGTIIVGSAGEDPKMLANFKDLLEKIFMLDPDKRITVSQALSHPFITGK